MSLISVFLKSEDPAVTLPRHSASKTLALLVLASHSARWTSERKCAIQLLTMETWRQVKDRVRRVPLLQRQMPLLNPPDYHVCNMLSYPPTGQESNARERQGALWAQATTF